MCRRRIAVWRRGHQSASSNRQNHNTQENTSHAITSVNQSFIKGPGSFFLSSPHRHHHRLVLIYVVVYVMPYLCDRYALPYVVGNLSYTHPLETSRPFRLVVCWRRDYSLPIKTTKQGRQSRDVRGVSDAVDAERAPRIIIRVFSNYKSSIPLFRVGGWHKKKKKPKQKKKGQMQRTCTP
ncbi:hypothetical protein F4778DRAFT_53789 [Xylariomycetidae sp. FL2044]|nr:hypothetical protein F4778DRAFT_53789 [Xylariomycetidae sp. FL2044]